MKTPWTPICYLLILGASSAWPGEAGAGDALIQPAQKGDFPGSRFVKPGSILPNIVVPRYENHRLTAMLNFGSVEILDRSHVLAKNLLAVMYGRTCGPTRIRTETAVFSFLDDTLRSGVGTTLENERFRAEGSDLTVQTKTHRGFLRGPVFMQMPALGSASDKLAATPGYGRPAGGNEPPEHPGGTGDAVKAETPAAPDTPCPDAAR